jgi:hypothetical protein
MKSHSLAILLILAGCSTALDILEEHPTVPVIYSMINPYDTVQYVRVQRTFIIFKNEDWANLNADSLQFLDAEVFLHGKAGDKIKWTEQLIRTSLSKDSGFFPTKDYRIFKLDHSLPIKLSKPLGRYDLGKPDVDSLLLEVKIIDLNMITRASAPVLTPYFLQSEPPGKEIFLFGKTPTRFSLPGGGEDCDPSQQVCYKQIVFKVHYKEYYKTSFAIKEIYWMTTAGWDEQGWYPMTPERLFNRMKMLIPKNENIITRILDSVDVTITNPSKCFSDFWSVKDYWENTDNPPFSNFDNSYGLFITYNIGTKTGYLLNRQSMDTLCNGYLYKEMKFKNW